MDDNTAPVAPNAGQTWAHRITGDRVVLLGRRTRTWVLRQVATGAVGEVTVEDLPRDYAWVACHHAEHCCPDHGVHVSPHRGCLLR